MKSIHWYNEIGDLVRAIGQDWFASTLQASLQSLFHFDHFLLVRYQRGKALKVLAADAVDADWRRALYWLEKETHVIEPIFQLFAARQIFDGVYDMAQLVRLASQVSAPRYTASQLPHAIEDSREAMGWRTMGWPQHQQETCLLVPLGEDELIAISLFNAGLERSDIQPECNLRTVFPALAPLLAAHFDGRPHPETPGLPDHTQAHQAGDANIVKPAQVEQFFHHTWQVQLSAREAAVFAHLLAGSTVPLVADCLKISAHTVRTHRRNVYRRLGHGRLPELINQFHRYRSKSPL